MKLTRTLPALALIATVAACSNTSAPQAAPTVTVTETPTPAQPSSTHTFTPSTYTPPVTATPETSRPASPHPNAKYTHECDYVLGNFTSHTPKGYRFIADARIHNTGNVGIVVQVKASWDLAGGGGITRSKTVRLPWHHSTRSSFTVETGQDEITRYQALGYGGNNCRVKATLVKTLGKAHSATQPTAPSSSLAGSQVYASVVSLRDDAVSAGLPCPTWRETDVIVHSSQSGDCSSSSVLAIYPNSQALQAAVKNFQGLNTLSRKVGLRVDPLLVGSNWTINSPKFVKRLQLTLGGRLYK